MTARAPLVDLDGAGRTRDRYLWCTAGHGGGGRPGCTLRRASGTGIASSDRLGRVGPPPTAPYRRYGDDHRLRRVVALRRRTRSGPSGAHVHPSLGTGTRSGLWRRDGVVAGPALWRHVVETCRRSAVRWAGLVWQRLVTAPDTTERSEPLTPLPGIDHAGAADQQAKAASATAAVSGRTSSCRAPVEILRRCGSTVAGLPHRSAR